MARANKPAEPCPLKSTIWLVESHDDDGTKIRVERSDTEIATVVLEEAEFTGEGVLVLQTQAILRTVSVTYQSLPDRRLTPAGRRVTDHASRASPLAPLELRGALLHKRLGGPPMVVGHEGANHVYRLEIHDVAQ